MGSRTVLPCCIVLFVTSACASGSGTASAERNDCALRPTDSLFMRDGPVFRECSVDRQARLTSEIPPDHPREMETCQRAAIEFVVGTTGVPELGTARVDLTNSETFALALIKTLPKWRYEPARRGGIPVRQIVRVERLLGPRRFAVSRATGPGTPSKATPSQGRPAGC